MLKKTVVMVGMMGAGKSAIGKSLAAALGVAFMDSDAEIEKSANSTIAEIFERDGEAFFRSAETKVLARLLSGPPVVLSTGGGAFMRAENRDIISATGVSLLLDADLELLWERVRHKDTRPLLQTDNPKQTLADIYAKRAPIYAMADLRVETKASYSIDDTTQAAIQVLKTRPDVLLKPDVLPKDAKL